MDNIKASSLLPAKALGCLDPEDESALDKLMDEDEIFPWEELGQYQNLVALLPTLLDIEHPERTIKDRVAKKLIELEEEKKAAENAEKAVEEELEIEPAVDEQPQPGTDLQSEELIMDEEIELDEPIPSTEPELEITEDDSLKNDTEIPEPDLTTTVESTAETLTPPESLNGGISFKEHGMPMIPMEERNREKPVKEKPPANLEEEIEKKIREKDVEQKRNRSAKYSYEPEVIVKTDKTALITAIILFVIAIAAIAFVYLKFSSEIDSNKKEIELLKSKPGAMLFQNEFDNYEPPNHLV